MEPVLKVTLRCTLVLAIAAALAGCGKSGSVVQPIPEKPISRQAADKLAEQSASALFENGALQRANNLILPQFAPALAMRARPIRPSRVGTVTTDSTEFWYEIHAFDASNHEVDWLTANLDSVSRLTMAWRFHLASGESFLWHTEGAYEYTGLASSAARLVINGAGNDEIAMDSRTPDYWWVLHFSGAENLAGIAYERSGSPSYPIAGRMALSWEGSWDVNDGTTRDAGSGSANCVVTFDGTRYADLQVAGYHYRIDLETGQVDGLGS